MAGIFEQKSSETNTLGDMTPRSHEPELPDAITTPRNRPMLRVS